MLGREVIGDFFSPLSQLFKIFSCYFYDKKLIYINITHKNNVLKKNNEESPICNISQLCNLE